MSAVTLPRLHWGPSDSDRRALLVHGLGSSAHTMWRIAESLADAGWSVDAVDLRGHGDAPRTSSYRIDEFAADLAATHPRGAGDPHDHGDARPTTQRGTWNLVVAHSIGGAAAVVAAAAHPRWTERLVLLDPALHTPAEARAAIRARQLTAKDSITIESAGAENPHWHPLDNELRVRAVHAASRFALEHAVLDNPDWDVMPHIPHLTQPTLVIGADPERGALFAGELADRALEANPLIEHVTVPGGHNVHRDAPTETLDALHEWLADF
ncbi:MAG: alpha/beta fold hydrolase [Microcella sp.]